MTKEIQKDSNAWLIAGDSYYGTVLLDNSERPQSYHWGWITIVREIDAD